MDSLTEVTTPYFSYTDVLDTNYVEYTYRITAIDPFADRSQSAFVKGMGRDLTPPKNPVITAGTYIESEGRIKLTYQIPEIPNDFGDLYFEYANHNDSAFVRYESETIDPKETEYYHTTEPDEYSHYFRLAMADTAKNISYSFPVFVNIPDTIPPPVPDQITANIDSTGLVEVKWTDEHLSEKGLRGYKLFYSNSLNHEFSQLTREPILTNFYVYSIPLNTLTEEIYYKVQAVDNSYNHSKFSEVVKAMKPDTIPPTTPTFKVPKVTEQSILLTWDPSSSQDVDKQMITRYRLDIDEIEIYQLPKNRVTYEDTTAQKGVLYEYTIIAFDDSNLESKESFPVRARVIDKKLADGIENLRASYNSTDRTVDIKWNYQLAGDYRFLIYRNLDNAKVKRYKTVEARFNSYEDKVSTPGTYHYAIKVVYKDGAKSLLSEQVSVNVQ